MYKYWFKFGQGVKWIYFLFVLKNFQCIIHLENIYKLGYVCRKK